MDETKRNSMKLDIAAVRLSENDHDQPTETYKQVSEFDSNDKSTGEFIYFLVVLCVLFFNQTNKLLAIFEE